MVARKGSLKPMDAWEETIRENAVGYTVIGFVPRKGTREMQTFDTMAPAKNYAKEIIMQSNEFRCVMVYAIDSDNHHALVATVNQYDKEIKLVSPERY